MTLIFLWTIPLPFSVGITRVEADVRTLEHPVMSVLADELKLSMEKLTAPDGTKPYFIQYSVTEHRSMDVAASLGALTDEGSEHNCVLDVDVRCGDYELDNTRQIRGGRFQPDMEFGGSLTNLPLHLADEAAVRQAAWLSTDRVFKSAVKRLSQVKANLKVKVEEEDKSDDFSRETPNVSIQEWVSFHGDRNRWGGLARGLSQRFKDHPLIYQSTVSISGSATNRLILNSEGTRLQFGRVLWRVSIEAATIAEDGMELQQFSAFDAHSEDGLPSEELLRHAVDQVIADVLALRKAPIVEPYAGPAILMNRASGVFFHEIFGHRIEGHRQKDVEEGQTFAKKLGQEVLPPFLSVTDDPSRKAFGNIELNGFYRFDEEGVAAQPARLVEEGVLRTFLMSRSPTRGITKSNGHGRRQPGSAVVARQGSLFVESTKQVPFSELRARMIEECRKQGKEYGLLFKDISGGFTMTGTWSPQAFKVLPILVYRVFVDGRPDELVRGVDIVGTPLTCFSKILCTADDAGVFNGICGAESGFVPVSAVSPSILVEQIEVEKKQKEQDRPPILPAPISLQRLDRTDSPP